MDTKGTSELCHLFADWRTEDRKLAVCVDEIRDWMSEVNQLGVPHFGETASRLQPLRDCLTEHFDREDAMLAKLAELYPAASPEVNAFKRQTSADHRLLLSRLDELHARLKEVDPPFASWTDAMDEVDVFFEEMEQHERSEADRVGMLMPGASEQGDDLIGGS
ncbi:hemerythrin domain-containing protein [Rhodopirellula sp. JC639]|uniref:hemerythrin domain-containing protein n=1 Tax=Stieleria mannarensis TaxID=2755585 RepID=UPI001600AB27|nr:hemerythrin domain-containing protein [Rhodopirellula sp. JC639]